MDFSLNYLTKLPPFERSRYVQEHLSEIAGLTDKQKERVGTLLCHASPPEVRQERPIISDLKANPAQEFFEALLLDGVAPDEARELTLRRYPNAK